MLNQIDVINTLRAKIKPNLFINLCVQIFNRLTTRGGHRKSFRYYYSVSGIIPVMNI